MSVNLGKLMIFLGEFGINLAFFNVSELILTVPSNLHKLLPLTPLMTVLVSLISDNSFASLTTWVVAPESRTNFVWVNSSTKLISSSSAFLSKLIS